MLWSGRNALIITSSYNTLSTYRDTKLHVVFYFGQVLQDTLLSQNNNWAVKKGGKVPYHDLNIEVLRVVSIHGVEP